MIFLGVVCIFAAAALTLYNRWEDKRAGEEAAALGEEVRTAIEKQEEPAEDVNKNKKTVTVMGEEFLGCLLIPSAGLEIPVLADFSMEGMERGAVWYAGSRDTNDLVIAGHNYTRIFRPIKQLPVGTKIQLMDAWGEVTDYEVSGLETLGPYQVEELKAQSDDWDLSLFTCTTGGASRYVLRCSRVESAEIYQNQKSKS